MHSDSVAMGGDGSLSENPGFVLNAYSGRKADEGEDESVDDSTTDLEGVAGRMILTGALQEDSRESPRRSIPKQLCVLVAQIDLPDREKGLEACLLRREDHLQTFVLLFRDLQKPSLLRFRTYFRGYAKVHGSVEAFQVDTHTAGQALSGYDSNGRVGLVTDGSHDAGLPDRLAVLAFEDGFGDDAQLSEGPERCESAEEKFDAPLFDRLGAQALHLFRMRRTVVEVFGGHACKAEAGRKGGLDRQGQPPPEGRKNYRQSGDPRLRVRRAASSLR